MSDEKFLFLSVMLFSWGYFSARGMDLIRRSEEDRRRREASKQLYLQQRRVRLDGLQWGDDA